jgi:Zn-dependent metalloprotease/PKD repeat protein
MPSLKLSTDNKYINKVIRNNGNPVYIEKKANTSKSSGAADFEERFYMFLTETRSITGITEPRGQFKITEILTDIVGTTHIKAVQQYKGIEIYGSESTLHINNQNERYTGSFCKIGDKVPASPKISEANAVQKVIGDLRQKTVLKDLSTKEKKILHYDSPVSRLVVYSEDKTEYELAWEVSIRPNFIEIWRYFISAETGEIIHSYNNTCSDGPVTGTGYDLNNVQRNVQAYLENGTYYMMNMAEPMYNQTTGEGVILTLDANNTSTSNLDYKYITSSDNNWTSKTAVSAHYNAGRTYEYFNNTFGHNSINGDGGDIISLINVAEDDGSSMENAFWNGQAAFYGNGGTNFKPLAGALDVTAHELGHGVISNTANLEYEGQSGAINEGYADIFGSMVDRDDWLIGEDITKTTFSPSGALRNMADPHNMGISGNSYWQPKHVSEMYLGSKDNGGVHINSGIVSYAYYLYATAVTKNKAEKVFYQALDKYLTKTSQFIDLRIAVVQSATDLYGAGAQEVVKAGESFDAVGVYEEKQVDKTQDYNVNPGTEYLLCYSTDNSNSATLALFNGTSLQTLSTTVMKGKASVTDDGASAVFVSSDSKIRYKSLDPLQPEVLLSDQAFWDNVAISKDGKRLAAISTEVDASIYVYDFSSKKWTQFKLYNPTTSQFNTDAGGVLYADAIEFDITGEYIIYDACNTLSSSTTEDINYWDIGFIKIWDNTKNTFGDGSISKLYGSLPENVSVGNPVFSKNSPSIIAFDYIDSYAKEYAILGTDLNSGETDLITSNATPGYPSFSKSDDKIGFSALTTSDAEVVAAIGLAQNKISGSGDAYAMINNAKWPVYFAAGDRTLGLAPVSDFTADYKTGEAPLDVKYLDLSANSPTSWLWTFQGGNPSTSTQQNPIVKYSTIGTFKVTLTTQNNFGNNTNVKEGYITITSPTGINDPEYRTVNSYPNPVKDVLTIECSYDFTARILNVNGVVILKSENERLLDLSGMRQGLYILEIKAKNGVFRQKLIKK